MRAILFDAGATLLHPDPPVEAVYARELAADGARFTDAELGAALRRVWDEVRERPAADRYGGTSGETAFWRAFLDHVRGLLDGGSVSEQAFGRLARHFRDPSSWAIYPDVLPALGRLARVGLKLAVVSNWDSHLPALLEGLALRSHFEAVLASAIERTGKPDPEIFRRACERLGVAPENALHVGDSLLEDFEGARRAGVRALLLDRDARHKEIPDRIESLEELADRLET